MSQELLDAAPGPFFEAQLPGIWHCGSIVESCHGWVVVHVLGYQRQILIH